MFASRRPEKNRRGRFWDWINPALGKEVQAWMAGPFVGVETHYLGRTQPCRRYITGGRMRCYCSTSKLAVTWKGYVPLWDANGVKCFAIIGERYADLVSAIPMFSPVTVTRLRREGSPVCVKQSAWTDQAPPSRDGSHKLQDLRPWLLKLWGDQDLIEWLNAHPEVHKDDVQGQIELDACLPSHLAAARRVNEIHPDPPTITDTLSRMPVLNGKKGK